ncbi:MAG: hypothetical protein ACKVP7_29240 [Hyphomicrobiaceae bacterium]
MASKRKTALYLLTWLALILVANLWPSRAQGQGQNPGSTLAHVLLTDQDAEGRLIVRKWPKRSIVIRPAVEFFSSIPSSQFGGIDNISLLRRVALRVGALTGNNIVIIYPTLDPRWHRARGRQVIDFNLAAKSGLLSFEALMERSTKDTIIVGQDSSLMRMTSSLGAIDPAECHIVFSPQRMVQEELFLSLQRDGFVVDGYSEDYNPSDVNFTGTCGTPAAAFFMESRLGLKFWLAGSVVVEHACSPNLRNDKPIIACINKRYEDRSHRIFHSCLLAALGVTGSPVRLSGEDNSEGRQYCNNGAANRQQYDIVRLLNRFRSKKFDKRSSVRGWGYTGAAIASLTSQITAHRLYQNQCANEDALHRVARNTLRQLEPGMLLNAVPKATLDVEELSSIRKPPRVEDWKCN